MILLFYKLLYHPSPFSSNYFLKNLLSTFLRDQCIDLFTPISDFFDNLIRLVMIDIFYISIIFYWEYDFTSRWCCSVSVFLSVLHYQTSWQHVDLKSTNWMFVHYDTTHYTCVMYSKFIKHTLLNTTHYFLN